MELNEPRLLIDGYPAPAHWGENRIRVPAGRRQIAVSVEPAMNLFQLALGPALTAVAVAPGQQVQLFYSMPRFARMAGAIGTVPQPRPGWGLFLLLCIGPGALALIVVGFVLVVLHYF